MSRSLRVHQDYIQKVKLSVKRNGYPRQKDLAEELTFSLATVGNFLNGKRVDYYYFTEICRVLGMDWKEVAVFEEDNGKIQSTKETIVLEPKVIIPCLEEEAFIYVERPPIETSCHTTLLNSGALVRIKAPSLTGKTSLIVRTLSKITQQGYRTVYLNLHLANQADFNNLDEFLKWFCISVGQSLGLKNKLIDYWDEDFSTSKVDCTDYFEKYLLVQVDDNLVLALDEVDRIFPYREVATEFFGLLRAWHEQAKIRKIWKKLRLIIPHSTEVFIQMDINSSPFSVGLPIELPDFTSLQVQKLAQLHGLELTEVEIKQLMDLVGGHPYLVEQAFSHLKTYSNISLDKLLQTALTEAGIYRNHLLHLGRLIQKNPQLFEAFKKVVTTTTQVRLQPIQAYKLHSMGLVKLEGNYVTPRCNLYKQYFLECLF